VSLVRITPERELAFVAEGLVKFRALDDWVTDPVIGAVLHDIPSMKDGALVRKLVGDLVLRSERHGPAAAEAALVFLEGPEGTSCGVWDALGIVGAAALSLQTS
jgi:hypothetical protein